MTKLTIADIADLREYEREREGFRAHIIALKKRRRVGVGPIVTMVFENRDTIRFQVQEMARAERIITDEGIETELRIYNPLIPEPGQLSATLFIELRSDEAMRAWLPKLVGIETAAVLRFADGTEARCEVDPDHAEQLTRDDVTAAVHYVRFDVSDANVAQLASGGVALAIDHPDYRHQVELSADTVTELLADARP